MEVTEYSTEQIDAVNACVNLQQRVVPITGPAGTGKTSIMRHVHTALSGERVRCVMCAPTGKAAKRIFEATGIPAMTIHRLLEYPYPGERDPKTGKPLSQSVPKRDRMNPIEYDVVLCDEYAMVNWEVHNNLLAALPRGGCIRMFGDLQQLPPVEENKILAKKPSPFAAMIEKFSPVILTQVFRQTEGSDVLTNAMQILRGRIPSRKAHFTMDITDKPIDALEHYVFDMASGDIHFDNIENQILVPAKKSWVGSYKLNHHLQSIYQPSASVIGLKLPRHEWEKSMPVWLVVGDKVVWQQNTYDLRSYPDRFEDEDFTRYIQPAPEQMILNGETGIVTEITPPGAPNAGSFKIDVGDRVVTIPNELIELTRRNTLVPIDIRTRCALAYALTTHKAQGSEYNYVVYVLNKSVGYMCNRHNIYTAITRARHNVHIISDVRTLQLSVTRKDT